MLITDNMLHDIIRHNIACIPGWRTNRKLVVIESDDWGSVRMPSKTIYEKFLKAGIRVDNDPYCKFDNLANKDDLTFLYEVLHSVKDKNGKPAVITANTIVANPDFDKIKSSNFQEYFFEPFTETLNRYSNHAGVWELWQQGLQSGVFYPQFHGREHLNVKKWLNVLQSNEFATRLAFDYGTFGLTNNTHPDIKGTYMGAFDSNVTDDLNYYESVINEGLELFNKLFGYRSKSFIATTYTWDSAIERYLKNNGVRYLQGLITQRIPKDDGVHFYYSKNNFQGKLNSNNLFYLTRNSFFEPTHFKNNIDVVNDCLNRVSIAFRWKKAAVISTHRLNFIGSLVEKNRDENLYLFQKLLKSIIKKWPDVEFINSADLGDIMNGNRHD